MSIDDKLQHILDDTLQCFRLVYGLACAADGRIIVTSGTKSLLKWGGLYDTLFGTSELIRQLYTSLDGQILPRSYGQGEVYCILLKPDGSTLVGLFGQGQLDPQSRYQQREEIASHVKKMLGSS